MQQVFLKLGFGRVGYYPTFKMLGSSMSGMERSRIRAGIFGLGIPGYITSCFVRKLNLIDESFVGKKTRGHSLN